MRKNCWRTGFILGTLLTMLVAGCRGTSQAVEAGSGLEGTITISGAWALYPLMVQWADKFQDEYPSVTFDISAGGAGKGMTDVLADAVDIGMVSRRIYPEEEAKGAVWISVAKDAVFVTISQANPVRDELQDKGFDRETLNKIFITGEITSWGEAVNQQEIKEPIHVFTRSDAAGAPATWAEYFGMRQEDLLGIGVYGDPGLLEAVIKDPLGIGYNNLNYAFDQQTGNPVAGAQVVPIDVNNNGRVDEEEACYTKSQAVTSVAEGIYPSPPARDLNLVTNGQPSGLVLIFLEWILTEGQQYVDQAGYVALPDEQIKAGMEKLGPSG